jgi:hypothetical protein
MSPRIGDTLISMVVVHNLVRHGYAVTVYSRHAHALRDWFPGFEIRPAVAPADARSILGAHGVVLHAYAADVVGDTRQWHPNAWVMDEWPAYRQVKPMIDIQLDLCREDFGLTQLSRDNGLRVPGNVPAQVESHRAVIHPGASDAHKQWLPARFVRLARALAARGYAVSFVVPPHERHAWQWIGRYGFELKSCATLDELAGWLLRAGVFIGNDSGIAHLASNVGVPAVSLAMRPSIAKRWSPGWSPSLTLVPLPLLPGRWIKEALWKYFLPVARVDAAVERLAARVAGTPRAFGPRRPAYRKCD